MTCLSVYVFEGMVKTKMSLHVITNVYDFFSETNL